MRRDTQIGIILGVVILVVIGIFLSTRTTVYETKTPDLKLSEEKSVAESEVEKVEEIEEIDINDLIKEKKTALAKEDIQPVEELVEKTPVEPSKDDVTLEGKWEGTKAVPIEPEVADLIPPEVEETIDAVETKQDNEMSINATRHTVVSGDTLYHLARKYYDDSTMWHKIYEANENTIEDESFLEKGQMLIIPEITLAKKLTLSMEVPLKKRQDSEMSINATRHTVVSGDTLCHLARKYYDDSTMWKIIYEANEDTIVNENSLEEGQILTIPE
jgi:nucleoid-associated protein YgaU